MPPRVFTEEEREKLRESMLDQAIPLLEEYGLVHMSVDKITKKVGIGKSTFYNFFSSKEEYISIALEHNRRKMLDALDARFPKGKKMKPAEVFQMWFETFLVNKSVFKNFTAEDERALYEADKARGKDVSLERETYIANRLLCHMDGVRKDLNIGLISNYIKLIVLAYENSYMFHDSEMEHMQNELKIRMIDLMFEKEARDELIEMLKKQKN